MQLYDYPLIAPFDIFCQQEVSELELHVQLASQSSTGNM